MNEKQIKLVFVLKTIPSHKKMTGILLYFDEYPSVPHRRPQFSTLVPHKDHTFPAPKITQFNKKNSSVQHQNPSDQNQKPLSSTSPSVPHRKLLSSTPNPLSSLPKTPQFHTKNLSVQHQNPSVPPPPVPHRKQLSSTPKPPQFHTKKPSV